MAGLLTKLLFCLILVIMTNAIEPELIYEISSHRNSHLLPSILNVETQDHQ